MTISKISKWQGGTSATCKHPKPVLVVSGIVAGFLTYRQSCPDCGATASAIGKR